MSQKKNPELSAWIEEVRMMESDILFDSDIAAIEHISQDAVRQQRFRGRLPPPAGLDGDRVYTLKEDYLKVLEKELKTGTYKD
ncbi:MAG: hypothetical protein IJT98_03510 [Prevotella sp.]|nr:hypothetical protein [Prevotella sp.]